VDNKIAIQRIVWFVLLTLYPLDGKQPGPDKYDILQPATNKLSDVYKILFSANFDSHDNLKDVKTLPNIPIKAPLQVPIEMLFNITANLHHLITPANENKIPSSCMTEY